MKKSMLSCLRGAALLCFALTMARCGAEPAAPSASEPRPGSTRSALSTRSGKPAIGPSAVVTLECGDFHIEVTRRTGSSESRSEAENECERKLRRDRPSVECEPCSIRGACEELTRRSDIAMTCEREDGIWECSCGQRSVLGCWPCRDDDFAGVSGRGGCGAEVEGGDELAALQCF